MLLNQHFSLLMMKWQLMLGMKKKIPTQECLLVNPLLKKYLENRIVVLQLLQCDRNYILFT